MNPAGEKTIRVLIVEDSRSVAEFLAQLLGADPNILVVGTAFDGDQALDAVKRTKPHVITMDIHMPSVNGFEAARSIMESCPTPIVIVSASVSQTEMVTNFQALEAGALAVVAVPNGPGHPNHAHSVKELVDTVKLMSEVKVVRRWLRSKLVRSTGPLRRLDSVPPLNAPLHVVAVGASTGGPLALRNFLAGLPKNLPVPVLIVQHMTPGFTQGFVDWLSDASGFPTQIAVEGEVPLPGRAYVAPDNLHMGVSPDRRIVLTKDARENSMRPSVSFLFRSIEKVYGRNAAGVLLTGMGQDGVDELKRLKDAGAVTLAQDEESSVVHGMPGQAIKIGAATYVLPPEGIASMLGTLLAR